MTETWSKECGKWKSSKMCCTCTSTYTKIQNPHTRSQIPYSGLKDNNFDTMHIAYKRENRNCYSLLHYKRFRIFHPK